MEPKLELLISFLSAAEVLRGDAAFATTVAGRSTHHDNGFLKIVLAERNESAPGLRLHIWTPEHSESNAHSHGWDMESLIVHGGYTASEYVEEDGEGIPIDRFDFVSGKGGAYILGNRQPVYLKRQSTRNFGPGDYYRMERGMIHRVEQVSPAGAITIVRTWSRDDFGGQVYSNSAQPLAVTPRRTIDEPTLLHHLDNASSWARRLSV